MRRTPISLGALWCDMGVKSTVELTRQQAEDKFVELFLRSPLQERRARLWAQQHNDKELEDALERMNDLDKGGEGFENYTINRYMD